MSAAAAPQARWPAVLVSAAAGVAVIGMIVGMALHVDIGKSSWIDGVVVLAFASALVGIIGSLVLANVRRNVLWIGPMAVSIMVLLALLSVALSVNPAG